MIWLSLTETRTRLSHLIYKKNKEELTEQLNCSNSKLAKEEFGLACLESVCTIIIIETVATCKECT